MTRCQFDEVARILCYDGDDIGPIVPCANKAKYLMKMTGRDLGKKSIWIFKLCASCHNIFSKKVTDRKFLNPSDDEEDPFFVSVQFRKMTH